MADLEGGRIDPQAWAKQFAERFSFREAEQAAEDEERAEGAEEIDEIQNGVRLRMETNLQEAIGEMISILEKAGFKTEDISRALEHALDAHAKDTDLDVEYGNGLAGIARQMRFSLLECVFKEKYGNGLASLVGAFLRKGKYDTAAYQDLTALGKIYSFLNEQAGSSEPLNQVLFSFGDCKVAPLLDNRENLILFVRLSKISDDDLYIAIVDHVNDMTAKGDELNMQALEEALGVAEKGGLEALRKYREGLFQ